MQARFLLGPAGSGKTFRCLAEIQAELEREPQGAPLILLAPKQATFQLERQLLSSKSIEGYTRLQILSFDRLADYILKETQRRPGSLLSEEGRVMVLRALLAKKRDNLKIFRSSAGLNGFSRQLSLDMRELQRYQITPAQLLDLSLREHLSLPLREKLADFQLLLSAYQAWLKDHGLQDADCLLDEATLAIKQNPSAMPQVAKLWLDGFAEMTPQELSLLAAIAPSCDQMTLAFCLDHQQVSSKPDSWVSIWSGIHRTRQQCWSRLESVAGAQLSLELLPGTHPTRFTENPVLRHLEKNWSYPVPFDGVADPKAHLCLGLCSNPQAEAILAAREILKFVKRGGRFREVAIILRQMDGYHDALRRVLSIYDIPFFVDRRESVAHHPLAELTRSALGTLAYQWQHHDWFGALKSGLVSEQEEVIDRLENEALARGWKGKAWLNPLLAKDKEPHWAEKFRPQWIKPFIDLQKDLLRDGQLCPTGTQLANALTSFWDRLRVEETLERWHQNAVASESLATKERRQFLPPHETVWEQMNAWTKDLALAFHEEALPLQEWLPILEAGLSGLTVGVIPPALDQVLIGTVDRSRNPDLKLALMLGANEGIFPSVPSTSSLLTEADRDALEQCSVSLAPNTRALLSRERFYGYIACTRSTDRLVMTCSQRNILDKPLNPSSFFSRLQALFPSISIENFDANLPWTAAEHSCEIIAPLLRETSKKRAQPEGPKVSESAEPTKIFPKIDTLPEISSIAALRNKFQALLPPPDTFCLSGDIAARVYGPTLATSVSRLEQFAACAFKFFVNSGLSAEERKFFELDVREKGNFQHEVLAKFLEKVKSEGKRWRDLTPTEAKAKIASICQELAPEFHEGLLGADAQSRFAAESMSKSLQDFIGMAVQWAAHYNFEPHVAEMGFGMEGNTLPAWELELDQAHKLAFRGFIDRIDLCPVPGEDAAFVAVMDYKSSAKKLENILMKHGLQLQLPAYLSVLRHLKEAKPYFGVQKLIPAGVFFINLKGEFASGKNRSEVLGSVDDSYRSAYQHLGRFDFSALGHFDTRNSVSGEQFRFALKKNGEPSKVGSDLLPAEEFDQMLDQVEEHLLRMGREIFSGKALPDPFQRGSTRACDTCEFGAICRIDPWKHAFRILA